MLRPPWVCPARGRVLAPSTLRRLPAALHGAGPALRAAPVFGSSTKAQIRLGLRFVRLAFLKTSLDIYTLKRTLNSLVCTLDACLKCRASLVQPRAHLFVQLETSDENPETCGLSAAPAQRPWWPRGGQALLPPSGRPAGLAGALSPTLASCSSLRSSPRPLWTRLRWPRSTPLCAQHHGGHRGPGEDDRRVPLSWTRAAGGFSLPPPSLECGSVHCSCMRRLFTGFSDRL